MMLNKNQKIVLWAAIGIIVLMGLFPPWIRGTHITPTDSLRKPIGPTNFKESAAEYHFIFAPPPGNAGQDFFQHNYLSYGYRLDYGRLFLQWILIITVSGALLFLFREPRQAEQSP